MIENQRLLTEKILFDYYMISSIRENEIHSPFPFYLDKELFEAMVSSAEILNAVICRIINTKFKNSDELPFIMGKFMLDKEILSIQCPVSPFFWVRYDAFVRADGGIFFSEVNYDKPCAQREIAISDMLGPHNNPSANFRNAFYENFKSLSKDAFATNPKPTVVILVSPNHNEEIHLAHFYMDLLKDLNLEFVIASTDNIRVKDNQVFAFDKPIDIILRQFPTEFLYEIKDIKEILRLFEEGNLLIINDPRAIIAQTKSLFAYLWELVDADDLFLSQLEKATIKETIPYTTIFDKSKINDLFLNKNRYVIKAVYGRYSEQVYIGTMLSDEEWKLIINDVCESEDLHIIQEFCPIKKDEVLRFNGENFENKTAFGNFGIYLSNNKYCGSCIRWSPNYLSEDESVWVSPVGVSDRNIHIFQFVADHNYNSIFGKINDTAAFEFGFTGGYTGAQQSFSLDALILEEATFDEIKEATNKLANLFYKTTKHVQQNGAILCPVLGIAEELIPLVSQQLQNTLSFLGRFDFVFDNIGRLKLLEFNAETPAGIIESIGLNSLIKDTVKIPYNNPNENMAQQLRSEFSRIIDTYKSNTTIHDIGFASLAYPEDFYNTKFLFDILHNRDENFVLGEISGLHITNNKLGLYEQPLDAIYRYYPLDWLFIDECDKGLGEILKENTLCINEPSTFISQSKAFFALVWELYKGGFYNKEENDLILKYIPYTSLNPDDFPNDDYCAKPYFEREGKGVTFSIKEVDRDFIKDEMVFQDRIPIQTVSLTIHTTVSVTQEVVYPVIGAYVIGNEFGGIYTRAGGSVTDANAIYIPTYIKERGDL